MTGNRDSIGEIDLLAYADGLLRDDPVRRAAVERHLSRDPEAARFVADVVAQNEAIRGLYDHALEAPVPDRHLRALRTRRESRRQWLQRAAAVLLVGVAATGGWVVGNSARDGMPVPAELIERAAADPRGVGAADVGLVLPAVAGGDAVLGTDSVSLSFAAPDLSAFGYRLVARGRPDPGAPDLARLLYQGPGERVLRLFVRPRRDPSAGRVNTRTVRGVAVSYWSAGPVAVAMTTDDPAIDGRMVATAVQEAIDDARVDVRKEPDGGGAQMAVEAEGSRLLDDLHPVTSQLQ